MSAPRTFPLGVVLSASTGRLLCPLPDLHEALEYMVSSPVLAHAVPSIAPFVRADIWRQHPDLHGVDASGVTRENWSEWLDEQVALFGETRDLTPIPLFPGRVAAMNLEEDAS